MRGIPTLKLIDGVWMSGGRALRLRFGAHVEGGDRPFATSASSPATLPILFVMGGPGAGKGTQSTLLVREFGGDVSGTADGTVIPADVQRVIAAKHPPQPRSDAQSRFNAVHISVGALLRAELQRYKAGHESKWASAIQTAIDTGVILPGVVTVQLLAQEMQRVTQQQRAINAHLPPAFLIDGFPRSTDNVRHFQANIAPLAHLVNIRCTDDTLTRRLQHRAAQSADSGSGRSDDRLEVVVERLRVFHGETEGVLRWWLDECGRRRKEGGVGWMYDVDGEKSIPEVYEDVRRVYLQFVEQYKDQLS